MAARCLASTRYRCTEFCLIPSTYLGHNRWIIYMYQGCNGRQMVRCYVNIVIAISQVSPNQFRLLAGTKCLSNVKLELVWFDFCKTGPIYYISIVVHLIVFCDYIILFYLYCFIVFSLLYLHLNDSPALHPRGRSWPMRWAGIIQLGRHN